MNTQPESGTTAAALDPQNPWLGLFSYTEETRAYFHGRDEEVAELARRVQRKLLTVLFGQSGLGKTSLLRAGLVPRLRAEGYCPVYVRVDYSPESPSPSEQIKAAIFKASAGAGYWTQPGTAVAGESLWEFMHHRGDLLRDADGRALVPLLIFDQFEEVFTLGQADDAGPDHGPGGPCCRADDGASGQSSRRSGCASLKIRAVAQVRLSSALKSFSVLTMK